MEKEKIEQIIILVISCAVVLYGSYALVFKSKFKKIKTVTAKSKVLNADFTKASKEVRSLVRYKKKAKELETKTTKLERKLIRDDSFEYFLGIIKKLADSENVALQKSTLVSNVKTLPVNEEYAERWVTIETSAPYHSIGKLITKLENYSPFIRIVEINIVSSGNAIQTHNVNFTVGFLVKKKS